MRLSPQNTRFQYETPVLGPYCRSTTASGETQKANTFPCCQTSPSLVRYWFFVFEDIGLDVFWPNRGRKWKNSERTEPADKLNKRWRKIPFKHAKPTFLKTIVSACHSVKLMPRWKHLPAIRPARKEKS